MNIDDYFASLERSLGRNSLVAHLADSFTCLASDDHSSADDRLTGAASVEGLKTDNPNRHV